MVHATVITSQNAVSFLFEVHRTSCEYFLVVGSDGTIQLGPEVNIDLVRLLASELEEIGGFSLNLRNREHLHPY